MWAATRAWAPPFSYRTGYVPPRDVYVRTEFKVLNQKNTEERKDQIRQETPWIYVNDPRAIVELRQRLKGKMFDLIRDESFEKRKAAIWNEFIRSDLPEQEGDDRVKFDAVREALSQDKDLSRFDSAIAKLMGPWELDGLLEKLEHPSKDGSQAAILVANKGDEKELTRRVDVNQVRIAEVLPKIQKQLEGEFSRSSFTPTQSLVLSELVYNWLANQKLPHTLSPNADASRREIQKVVDATKVYDDYSQSKRIAEGGKPLDKSDIDLLRKEHAAQLQSLTLAQRLSHSMATFGMYLAIYVLCGFYIYNRKPRLLSDLRRFATLLAVVVATVALAWIAASDEWRAEIVPLLLFGMTVAIAYEKELALLLSACVSLIVAFSLEQGLGEFVILTSSVAAAILFLGRVRSRTKLIYVALFTGVVVMLTSVGVGTLAGQAFGATGPLIKAANEAMTYDGSGFIDRLLFSAAWYGACSLIAGLLMTGLLPFIERMFDVQTDISLLELGDAAHPLLQELVRRAPGTYNHSINVASIGEAAAEAVGANGLLVRVGAYFHDIGKMLKPQYFIENQGSEGNRHESLAPAMSTLVIIAHVKDGIDLARQHRLPETIVDFIAQHHGTTLVEYFFRRATRQSEEDPDGAEIDEANFRYPGPKPQTKETAVLMISDAVESASRALVDPTPARIESLVHELAMKRLLDGQFDECGLTLQELHLIEESVVKSLTAVYHGRVKYPEHQTA